MLKIFKLLVIWMVLLSFSIQVKGQDIKQKVDEIFGNKIEVYFSFPDPGLKMIPILSKTVSLDNLKEGKIYAYANKKEFTEFLSLGYDYTILTPPGMMYPAIMKNQVNVKSVTDWDFYPTYDAYVSMMYQFQTDYPGLCEIVNFGQTNEGRDLLAARISDNISTDEGEPQFLYTSSIHGDETTGYILTLRLINYLLTNYGTDPKVDNLVNNMEIWINPLANPDGTYHGGNSTVYGSIRYNAMGVDMNRNYPDPEAGPHPDGNAWQMETIAFMQLAEDNHFVASANFHGGEEVCNYPWDTWSNLCPDDAWWQYVCREYADTAHLHAPSGYMSGFDNGITNGYAWYTITGGRQDYMNYFQQCREVTIELSDQKTLPANQLPNLWEYNYRSMLNYMEQSLYGISGTVTDAITGDPLLAEVFIENHDEDSSWVYTYDINGKYYRLIQQGSYDLTFSAEGYYPQTIENVNVINHQLTLLDVQLTAGDLIGDFTASETAIPIGTTVDFTDLSFGNIISWEWTFEGGDPATSSVQNPTGIMYSDEGTYDVTLTISNGTDSQTIVKEDYITASVEFNMQNTTITTCTGVFYDSGGNDNDYGNNEDYTMTFLPGELGGKVQCEFTSFNVEFNASCDYDWLKIYDGTNTSAPLIGTYCGSDSPGIVLAENESGALTFEFHSDYSVTESGWTAVISCDLPVLPPVADFIADHDTILEGGTVVFTDLSINNPDAWEWTFDGGDPATSTNQNPEVTYEVPGIYTVSLTTFNAGGSNTLTKEDYIVVESPVGISENSAYGLQIYPNPAKTRVTLTIRKGSMKSIRILDISGETLHFEITDTKTAELNINNLRSGVYFLQIQTGETTIYRKLLVQR